MYSNLLTEIYILLHHHDRSLLCICEPLLIESLTQLIHFQRSSTCQFHRNLRHLLFSASSLSFFTATSLKRRALKRNWISWEILVWKRYHHLWNLAQILSHNLGTGSVSSDWESFQYSSTLTMYLKNCRSERCRACGKSSGAEGDQEILNPSTPQVPILTSIFELSLLWLRFCFFIISWRLFAILLQLKEVQIYNCDFEGAQKWIFCQVGVW